MKAVQPKLFLLLLLPLCIFLTFNKHSKDNAHSYHGVIWADAAGYYVHNPIWFIYGNNASAFPKNSDSLAGNGFHLNSCNRVVTKYYSGAAILMSPFFLVSHMLARPLGFEPDGFSMIYSYGLYFSGIIYCCLGLFSLSLFLRKHFSNAISVITPLIFFCCSNLFYYSIDAPAMSHVYSFFLLSVFMYSTQQLLTSDKIKWYLLFSISISLAVLTRPTNGIILLFPLFYEKGAFISRIFFLIRQWWKTLIALVIAALCFLPQIIYMKETFGKYFTNSYTNEGFDNWMHPRLLETWFSPNNGLFIYTPVLLLSIAGIILLIRKKDKMGYYFLFSFLLISYVFASWWNWWFGCSLGARSFVEFYTLLSIPMGFVIQETWKKNAVKYIIGGFLLLCCILYFNIEYYYDGCFYGDTWDFQTFIKMLR